MKVLHLIPSLSPLRGGTTEAVWGMSRALISQGVEVEIVATDDHGPGVCGWPLEVLQEWRGVPVRVFPRWSPSIGALREYQYASRLGRWLDGHIDKYDVVHTHVLFSYVPTIGMRLARNRGIPYLNSPSGLLCEWSMQQQRVKKTAYWRVIEKRNLCGASCLHFTSQNERRESNAWICGDTRTEVIPLGCVVESGKNLSGDFWRTQLGVIPGDVLFLFLGRIHPKKGLELLLRAMSTLKSIHWRLAIAGNGEPLYIDFLKALIQELSLTDRVAWVPFVEGGQKVALFEAADFFVLTSHSENFGITVVESLQCGTPVLLTEGVALAGEVAELGLGYSGPFSMPEVAKNLNRAIEKIRFWRGRREEIRKQATSTWSWQVCARRLKELYDSFSTGSRGPNTVDQ